MMDQIISEVWHLQPKISHFSEVQRIAFQPASVRESSKLYFNFN